jgi:hypothetical protein
MRSTSSSPLSIVNAMEQTVAPLTMASQSLNQPKSVLFVDRAVQDAASLVAQAAPGTQTYWLDPNQDAIAQMTRVLAGMQDVASVQVLSHGRSGGLQLGQSWLDVVSLPGYVSQLQAWAGSLTADADILLYGCNVGQDAAGQGFVQLLAQATGADVAASDDLTGNWELGGDWDLEVQTGTIEALGIRSSDYQHTLVGKYDWVQGITGDVNITPRDTVIDDAGNIYTIGLFAGTVDFAAGNPNATVSYYGPDFQTFVSKHNADGSLAWVKPIVLTQGLGGDVDCSITISPSGEVYFSTPVGASTFEPSLSEPSLIAKLDPLDGGELWGTVIAGTGVVAVDALDFDAAGNLYFGGWFNGTADFDPADAGIQNLTSAGGADAYVAKLNADGSFAWAKQFGGADNEQTDGIAVDSLGNVYSTGFGGNYSVNTINGNQTLTSQGETDGFINKFDPNGNLLWINQIANSDLSRDVAVDADGNAYFVGVFNSTLPIQIAGVNLSGNGSFDAFVARFNADGQFSWVKKIGGTGADWGDAIAVSPSNQVYVTGWFSDSISFNIGASTQTFTSSGGNDIFVTSLDSEGNFIWANQINGTGTFDKGFGISVNSSGKIALVGEFQNEVSFGAGSGIPNLNITPDRLGLFVSGMQDVPNQAPTAIGFTNIQAIVSENADMTTRRKVADITVFDDSVGTNTLSLSGADASSFEIIDQALYLKAGTVLSYETKASYAITVNVDDVTVGNTPDQSESLNITVSDTDPTLTLSASGNANEAGPINGSFQITLSEPSNVPLIVNYSLAGTALAGSDYALLVGNGISSVTNTSFTIDAGITTATFVVQVTDDAISESDETVILNLTATPSYTLSTASASINIITNDENLAPTAITLNNIQDTLAENTNTIAPIKVADIAITDDAFGDNQLTITGDDADSFEIVGDALYLKAGTVLSFETQSQYDITIAVDDATIGATPDASTTFSLIVIDVDPVIRVAPGAAANEQGLVDGRFDFTLSQAAASPIVVNYSLLDNLDTDSNDYTIVAGEGVTAVTATTFTIASGTTTAQLLVRPVDDAIVEPFQTVRIDLAPGNTYVLGSSSITPEFETEIDVAVQRDPVSVYLEDFNDDGNLDLVTANRDSGSVSVQLGDGTGALGETVNYAVGTGPSGVTAGDFNNDGSIDIATSNLITQNVSILFGDGLGGFEPAVNFAVNGVPESIATGLINEDNRLDIIVGSRNTSTVSVLLNNGDATFAPAINLTTNQGTVGVGLGDINGDGNLDIAAANADSDDVSVFLGDGTGGFSTAVNYTAGQDANSVTIADFDNDGNQDLAVTNYGDGTVSLLLGNGDGTFAAKSDYAVGATPMYSSVGDVDNDGNLDLAVATLNGGLSILVGNGDGTFDPTINLPTNSGLYSVRLGDLNKDGVLDIVTAKTGSAATGIRLGNKPTATIALFDNDPSIDITAGTTPDEDNETNGTFNITLNAASPEPITINYSLAGAAILDEDYTIVAGEGISELTATSFVIAPGITTASLTVAVINDTAKEAAETIDISLSGIPIANNPNTTVFINDTASLTIGASDPNNAPTSLSLNALQTAIPEGTNVERIQVANLIIEDDGFGENVITIGGTDAAKFEVEGTAVYLKAGTTLDYDTTQQLNITIAVDDVTVGNTPDLSQPLSIAVQEVNKAPTQLVLNNLQLSISEGVNAERIQVANVLIVDDELGENTITIRGVDADYFEVDGTKVYLKAGTTLDYETKSRLDITIEVDDVTVGNTPDKSEDLSIAITDQQELVPPPVDPGQFTGFMTRVAKRNPITQEVTVQIQNPTGEIVETVVTYGQPFVTQSGQTVKLTDKWRIVDTIDLNNDSVEDIIFQNSQEDEVGVWYMGVGGTVQALDYLRGTDGNILKTGRADWQAIGIASLGDARPRNLVLRNSVTDEIGYWFLGNGTTVTGYNYLRDSADNIVKLGQDWEIKGFGNFDGLSGDELVAYQKSSHQTNILQTQGLVMTKVHAVPSFNNNAWSIQGITDLDQDNRSEIIWSNQGLVDAVSQEAVIDSSVLISAEFEPISAIAMNRVDFVTDMNSPNSWL